MFCFRVGEDGKIKYHAYEIRKVNVPASKRKSQDLVPDPSSKKQKL